MRMSESAEPIDDLGIFERDCFPELQLASTRQRLSRKNYPTSISSLVDSLANDFNRHKIEDIVIPGAYYFLRLLGLHHKNDHAVIFLKTSRVCYIDKTSRLRKKSLECFLPYCMARNSVCLTLRRECQVKKQNVPTLSELLDGSVYNKYSPSSQKASDGSDLSILVNERIRHITPIDLERLQGFPDNHTAGVPDTVRYRLLGNSTNVMVASYILGLLYERSKKK